MPDAVPGVLQSVQGMNLKEFLEYRLTVPAFQRAYAWDEDKVKNLMDSIRRAYEQDAILRDQRQVDEPQNALLLSTVYVIKESRGSAFEVIDGQQRTITLSLITAVGTAILKGRYHKLFGEQRNDLYRDGERLEPKDVKDMKRKADKIINELDSKFCDDNKAKLNLENEGRSRQKGTARGVFDAIMAHCGEDASDIVDVEYPWKDQLREQDMATHRGLQALCANCDVIEEWFEENFSQDEDDCVTNFEELKKFMQQGLLENVMFLLCDVKQYSAAMNIYQSANILPMEMDNATRVIFSICSAYQEKAIEEHLSQEDRDSFILETGHLCENIRTSEEKLQRWILRAKGKGLSMGSAHGYFKSSDILTDVLKFLRHIHDPTNKCVKQGTPDPDIVKYLADCWKENIDNPDEVCGLKAKPHANQPRRTKQHKFTTMLTLCCTYYEVIIHPQDAQRLHTKPWHDKDTRQKTIMAVMRLRSIPHPELWLPLALKLFMECDCQNKIRGAVQVDINTSLDNLEALLTHTLVTTNTKDKAERRIKEVCDGQLKNVKAWNYQSGGGVLIPPLDVDQQCQLLTALEHDKFLKSRNPVAARHVLLRIGNADQLTPQQQEDRSLFYVSSFVEPKATNAKRNCNKTLTVEHILPQSHGSFYGPDHSAFGDEDKRNDAVHRLGNGVVITLTQNSKLYNKVWKDGRNPCKHSEFKRLFDEHESELSPSALAFCKNLPEEWNIDAFWKRHKNMIEIAKNLWGISKEAQRKYDGGDHIGGENPELDAEQAASERETRKDQDLVKLLTRTGAQLKSIARSEGASRKTGTKEKVAQAIVNRRWELGIYSRDGGDDGDSGDESSTVNSSSEMRAGLPDSAKDQIVLESIMEMTGVRQDETKVQDGNGPISRSSCDGLGADPPTDHTGASDKRKSDSDETHPKRPRHEDGKGSDGDGGPSSSNSSAASADPPGEQAGTEVSSGSGFDTSPGVSNGPADVDQDREICAEKEDHCRLQEHTGKELEAMALGAESNTAPQKPGVAAPGAEEGGKRKPTDDPSKESKRSKHEDGKGSDGDGDRNSSNSSAASADPPGEQAGTEVSSGLEYDTSPGILNGPADADQDREKLEEALFQETRRLEHEHTGKELKDIAIKENARRKTGSKWDIAFSIAWIRHSKEKEALSQEASAV